MFRFEEVNPHSVSRTDLVVAIPTFNEVETVSSVVQAVDQGLERYFLDCRSVIVNDDNASPDGTITKNFAYPMISAVFGHRLRQPIRGDYGISRSLVDFYLD